jgi:hypothetical protein
MAMTCSTDIAVWDGLTGNFPQPLTGEHRHSRNDRNYVAAVGKGAGTKRPDFDHQAIESGSLIPDRGNRCQTRTGVAHGGVEFVQGKPKH